jgi:LysM repeat protein
MRSSRTPYRRKRRTNLVPIVLALAAVLFLGVGSAIVFVSLSNVATPTETPTITATATTAPTYTPSITSTITETAGPSPTATERPVLTYTVAAGDSLFSIAAQFELTIEQLVAANQVGDCAGLTVGQVLTIPPISYQPPTLTPLPTGLSVNARLFHTVKPGDTLLLIADIYQTTTDDILERNAEIITDPNNLPVCAVLEVRWGLNPWTPTLPGFTITPNATEPAPSGTPDVSATP